MVDCFTADDEDDDDDDGDDEIYECDDKFYFPKSTLTSARMMSVPEPAVAAGEKSSSVYLSIISQQTFIGCWKLNTELSNLLNVSLDQLQNSAPVKVRFIYGFL